MHGLHEFPLWKNDLEVRDDGYVVHAIRSVIVALNQCLSFVASVHAPAFYYVDTG